MGKTYLNRDDMRMRLDRSVVSFKGEPWYCDVDTPVKEWFNVTLHPFEGVKGLKPQTVDHRSNDFSGASLEVGYFNHEASAYYAEREPARMQKAGLNYENINIVPRKPGPNFLISNGFYNMLKDDYPTKEEAIKLLRQRDVKKIAVSKWFAYGWEGNLRIAVYFQERVIGYYSLDTGLINILSDKAISFIMRKAKLSGAM